MKNIITLLLVSICFSVCNGQGYTHSNAPKDTVPVLCQVVDTSHIYQLPDDVLIDSVSGTNNINVDSMLFWSNGKEVKIIDLGLPERLDTYSTVLYSVRQKHNTSEGVLDAGFCVNCEWHDYWKHLYYLDKDKLPLDKSIIVWQSIEIK